MVWKGVAALVAVVMAPQIGLAQERESTLFLERAPTVQELIDALAPSQGATRGIRLEVDGTEGGLKPIDQDPLKVVENPDPEITVTDVGLRVQFAFDSAELTSTARAELDTFAAAIVSDALKDSLFVVEGHTDSIGAAPYNQTLSERRAREARRYLVVQHGIAPERLSTIGHGESKPLPNVPPDAADNRRVHFATAWHGS